MKASKLLTLALISILALQPFLLPSRFVARADESAPTEAAVDTTVTTDTVTADPAPADTGSSDTPSATDDTITPDNISNNPAPCAASEADGTCQAPVPGAKPDPVTQQDPAVNTSSDSSSNSGDTAVDTDGTASGTNSSTISSSGSTDASGIPVATTGDTIGSTEGASGTSSTDGSQNSTTTQGSGSAPTMPDMPVLQTSGSTTAATTTTSGITPGEWPFVTAPDASTTASTTDLVSTTTTATTTGPTIQSGQSVALANILNILNTNIVNSVGNAFLLNFVDPVTGTVDLRGGMTVSSTSAICAVFACTGSSGVSVNLAGDAGIQNALVLSATSGGNEIDHAGDAAIQTGNAYAGLNLINLANTNIVDSNYLLVSMNAFQGVNGDIVFPSLSNFLSSLAHTLSPGSFTSTGTATVDNHVTADAETGGNVTSSTTASSISSGAGASTGNVFNQLNSDMLGGANVSILFRVQGNWAGQVFGAPAGLQWTQGPDGTIALFDTSGSGSGSQSLSNLSQVTSSSTADIANNINVIALTGQNKINDANTALITTGNALASANVLNVANTNVVGKNWILAIINIFGDFTGNIAFGRPDLWAGEQVSVPSGVGNGSDITYKYTVINNGDSPASDVQLTDTFDAAHITIGSASVPYTTDGSGNLVWSLGDIPAGGAVEVSYHGTVQNAGPGTNITNSIHAAEHETDNNTADNSDSATVSIPLPSGSYTLAANQPNKDLTPAASSTTVHLSVTRTPADTSVRGSGSVHQVLTLTNDGDAASIPLTIHDVLHAPDGTAVNDESWDVGSLDGGESVQLAYDASFAANAPAGTYALSTSLYDESGTLLGTFDGNGHITRSAASPLVAVWHALVSSKVSKVVPASTDSAMNEFPDVGVAHAAGIGNQAAAVGLLGLAWPYALALIVLLLAALFLTATRRRQQDTA